MGTRTRLIVTSLTAQGYTATVRTSSRLLSWWNKPNLTYRTASHIRNSLKSSVWILTDVTTTLSKDSLVSYTAHTGRAQICVNVLLSSLTYRKVVVGCDSSVGIATRYGLDTFSVCLRVYRWWNETGFYVIRSGDRIPVAGEIFRTRPDLPWGPPSLLYNGYRVFPGGKAAGAWRWPPITI